MICQNNKIAIGTVNFGLDYGTFNEVGKLKFKDVEKIIQFSFEKGINTLDTASAYGESEKVLGMIGVDKFNIVSKFTACSEDQLMKEFDNSIDNLKVNSLYAYMSHNPNQIFENYKLWDRLLILKDEGRIKKIGLSINKISQISSLLDFKIKPDIVQVPYNLLDHRFIKIIKELKKNGTEIHSRSTFLQGLVFIDPKKLPKRLKSFSSSLMELNKICSKFDLKMFDLALNFAIFNVSVDKVLIGVQSIEELEMNLKIVNNELPIELINDIFSYMV